jgi:hypothetical protein
MPNRTIHGPPLPTTQYHPRAHPHNQAPTPPPPHSTLPILKHLRFPALLQLCLPTRLLLRLPYLTLYPLPRPQNLTLQIKAPSLLRIIAIKQLLKPLRHILYIRLATLRWLHVQDLARFFKSEAMGGKCVCCPWIVLCLGFGVL